MNHILSGHKLWIKENFPTQTFAYLQHAFAYLTRMYFFDTKAYSIFCTPSRKFLVGRTFSTKRTVEFYMPMGNSNLTGINQGICWFPRTVTGSIFQLGVYWSFDGKWETGA